MQNLLIIASFIISFTHASHFRGGAYSWTRVDQTITLTQTHGWRSTWNHGNHLSDWGDNTGGAHTHGGAVVASGQDVAGEGWVLSEETWTHTYSSYIAYTAYYSSCCRIGSLILGGSNSFRTEVKIDLSKNSMHGPQVSLPPNVQFPLGTPHSITLQTSDADGDVVKCRKSTDAESLINGLDTTTHFSVSSDCILTGTLPAVGGPIVSGSKWATQIMLYTEDASGDEMDRTAVDFIMEGIVGSPPICNIITAAPFEVEVGGSMSVEFEVSSPDGSAHLDINVISIADTTSLITPVLTPGDGASVNVALGIGTITYSVAIDGSASQLDGSNVGVSFEIIDPNNGFTAVCAAAVTVVLSDIDGDGIPDIIDECPNDFDNDIDGDGVCGDVDNCPNIANAGQCDYDNDGYGDVCDPCVFAGMNALDRDNDGVPDVCDKCPGFDDNIDSDGDGIPDACDICFGDNYADLDNDGIPDCIDNCVSVANPDQSDIDNDGKGDVCDYDQACCIENCDGIPDGYYQSCQGCTVYATCAAGGVFYDNRPCAQGPGGVGLFWDDNIKGCVYQSETCDHTGLVQPIPCP